MNYATDPLDPKNVLFIVSPEVSRINSTLWLANVIEEMGFSCQFLLEERFRDRIVREGYGFISLGEKNLVSELNILNYKMRFKKLRRELEEIQRLVKEIVNIQKPSLVFVSHTLILSVGKLLSSKSISVIPLIHEYMDTETEFISYPSHLYLTTQSCRSYRYCKVFFSKLVIALDRLLSIRHHGSNMFGLHKEMRNLANLTGLGLQNGRIAFDSLKIPSILLAPQRFSPNRFSDHMISAGLSVKASRKECELPDYLEMLDKPIVLVSFGTLFKDKFVKDQMFYDLVEIFSRDDKYALVIHSGDEEIAKELNNLKHPNVYCLNEVPVLRLLRQSRLFITHAGLSSIREAIHFGVPCLCYPQFYDQPGNAAWVVSAGFGIRLTRKYTKEQLRSGVFELLHNPKYKEKVDEMRKAIVDDCEEKHVILMLRRILRVD